MRFSRIRERRTRINPATPRNRSVVVSTSNHPSAEIEFQSLECRDTKKEWTLLSQEIFNGSALSLKEAEARELHSAKRVPEAVAVLREVLAARLELQGERHFQTINARSGLARSLRAIHQYDECF